MTELAFAKMQSCGNDFVVIDAVRQALPQNLDFAAIADRKRGVGCDQILILQKAEGGDGADFVYRVVNADGGEVGQCGNGARCAHLFLRESGLTQKKKITMRTKTTRITTELAGGGEVRAYLGVPNFAADAVPLNLPTAEWYRADGIVPGFAVPFVALSLGNPHAVFFADDNNDDGNGNSVTVRPGENKNKNDSFFARVNEIGEKLNAARELFPEGANVGFCRILPGGKLQLRVYERGAGETESCGSGAAAATAAAIRNRNAKSPVTVQTPGGNLLCGRDGDGEVWIQATVTFVFTGVWGVL